MTLGEVKPTSDYLKPMFEQNQVLFKEMADNRDRLGKSILNVGLDHNPNGVESTPWIDYFINQLKFDKVCILELNDRNYAYHTKYFAKNDNVRVIHGDVRSSLKFFNPKSIDTSFWWHGPEHIELGTLWAAFYNLFAITKNCSIFGCPWGDGYTLDPKFYHSKEDWHKYHPQKEHFEPFGFNIFCMGSEGSNGAGLTGIKFFK